VRFSCPINPRELSFLDLDEPHLQRQLIDLQAVAFDVDGVLSDGTLTWSANGDELKSFSFADIMGISLLRRLGIKIGLISGEPSPLVDRYAEKMHISFVAKGVRDKATALEQFAVTSGVSLEQTCFFGDDVNDLSAMFIAGLSACPSTAVHEVLEYVRVGGFVAPAAGGNGAVRSFADAILRARRLTGREVFLLRPPQ
jgi:3-deoxy-D-manno-octulosonate 8-phosphate phosphatase (KDO 8-P phosphatase)